MTDGGRMARVNGRVSTEESHPSNDTRPSEASSGTAACGVMERQVEEHSNSLESSCSDLSAIAPESGFHTSMKMHQAAGGAPKCDNSTDGSSEMLDGPPSNFGIVVPGLYRSAFPRTSNYAYLETLGLKTIVTLSSKDHPDDYKAFIIKNGITHITINMEGTKKVAIPNAVMDSVLEFVVDVQNYPLLLHCNHGKHRTGCVVAVIRKIMGWHIDPIIEEYTSYAEPKIRPVDISYVEAFNVEGLPGYLTGASLFTGTHASDLSFVKMMKMLTIALLLLIIWAMTAILFRF